MTKMTNSKFQNGRWSISCTIVMLLSLGEKSDFSKIWQAHGQDVRLTLQI